MYPSTLLAQIADKKDPKDIEREIQKADLDLLKKINELAGGSNVTIVEKSVGSAELIYPLPDYRTVRGQEFELWKTDSGAGELKVVDKAGGLFFYPGTTTGVAQMYVGLAMQRARFRPGEKGWNWIEGSMQPIALEPDVGRMHKHIYSFSAVIYSDTAPGASNFKTVTVSGLPAGTSAIELVGYIVNGAAGEECRWRPYGSTDTSAQSQHRMLAIRPAGGTAYCGARGIVTVDSAGRFDICVTDANDDIYLRGYSFYWL